MKKMIFLGLAAATVFAGAAPATAQYRGGGYGYDRYDDRYDRYDRYDRRRGRNSAVSPTDRDGDGFDDRDLNFDHFIDAREHRRAGTGSFSPTDRDGDGYDDRDLNGDHFIDQREHQIAGTNGYVGPANAYRAPARRRYRR